MTRSDLMVLCTGEDGAAADVIRRALASSGCTESDSDVDAAVLVCELPAPERIDALDEAGWIESVEGPLARSLESLQAARRALRNQGGSIVVVTPNVGIVGAGGLVPLTTVVEGVRSMTKSAARQWAPEGMQVNLLALPLTVLDPSLESFTLHLTPPPGSVPTEVDIGLTLLPLLQAPPSMIGATVVLDGGSVMAP